MVEGSWGVLVVVGEENEKTAKLSGEGPQMGRGSCKKPGKGIDIH